LLPSVVALCCAGVYAFRVCWFDVVVAAALGVIGFFMLGYKFQLVPVLLGTRIGPLVDGHFRQGLTAANRAVTYVITHPLAVGMRGFDLVVASALGVLGVFSLRYIVQLVAVRLGTLVGPLVERHFRQGLTAANGDLTYFIAHPVAAGIWIGVVLIVVALPVMRWWLGRKQQADQTTAEVQNQSAI